jgi:hypothetical protein
MASLFSRHNINRIVLSAVLGTFTLTYAFRFMLPLKVVLESMKLRSFIG